MLNHGDYRDIYDHNKRLGVEVVFSDCMWYVIRMIVCKYKHIVISILLKANIKLWTVES